MRKPKNPNLKLVVDQPTKKPPWETKPREELTPDELAEWDRKLDVDCRRTMREQSQQESRRKVVGKKHVFTCDLDFLLTLFKVSQTMTELKVGQWLQRLFYFDRTKQRRGYVTLSKQDLDQLHVSPDAANCALRALEANKLITLEHRGRGRKPHIKPA